MQVNSKGYFSLVISIIFVACSYAAAPQTLQLASAVQQPTSSVHQIGCCGYGILCCGCTWYCCKCCAECKAALALRTMPLAGQRVLAKRPSVALKGLAQNTANFNVIICAREQARKNCGITPQLAAKAQADEMQKIDAALAAQVGASVTKTEPSASPPSVPSMMRDSVSTNSQPANAV